MKGYAELEQKVERLLKRALIDMDVDSESPWTDSRPPSLTISQPSAQAPHGLSPDHPELKKL